MKKAKKLLALLLSLAMLFAMVGCGGEETADTSSQVAAGEEDADGQLLDFDDVSGTVKDPNASGGSGGAGGAGGAGGSGGGAGGGVQANPNATAPMQGSDPFANIPARLKGTTMTFAHFGDEGADEYQKVFKAFTKKTGIKVNVVSFQQAEYESQIAKQISALSGPDAIICNGTWPEQIQNAQPLQNIIDLGDDFWDDNITKTTTINGNTYFVNSYKSIWQNFNYVFFNSKIFSNNGLTSPRDYWKKNDWSYENLIKCIEAVKNLGSQYTGGRIDPWALATQMGTPCVGYDPATYQFTAHVDAQREPLQLLASHSQQGLWNPAYYWASFSLGTIGIYVSGNYGAKYNGYFKDMDNSAIDSVPMPTSYKGKALKPAGSVRAYGIAKGAKNAEGAAYFLRYFLDYSYYKAAGCNAFKNSKLEDTWFNEVIPEVQKKGIVYNYADHTLASYANSSTSEAFPSTTGANPNEIPNILASGKNIVETAAKKATEAVAKYK